MKTNHILTLIFGLSVTISQSFAQNLAISDEELLKYATAVDSVNEMSASVRLELADMVKSSDAVKPSRYNDLNKIINDSTKLAEAKATPEEIAFVKQVVAKKEEGMTNINATYQTLAKEYVTPAVFNKVKKAIASDAMTKKRYDSLMVELAKDDPTADQ